MMQKSVAKKKGSIHTLAKRLEKLIANNCKWSNFLFLIQWQWTLNSIPPRLKTRNKHYVEKDFSIIFYTVMLF